jgi:hypothetical protein
MPTLTMRPAGVLGDNADTTYESALGPTPGAGADGLGTLRVRAVSLTPSGDLGHITTVTLGASVRHADPQSRTSGQMLTWTQCGGDVAVEVAPLTGFGTTSFLTCLSAVCPLNPWTGNVWEWNDLNRLVLLGAQLDYDYHKADTGQIALYVSEVWASVAYELRAGDSVKNEVGLSCKPHMMDLESGDAAVSLGIKPRGIDLTAGDVAVVLTVKPRIAEVGA